MSKRELIFELTTESPTWPVFESAAEKGLSVFFPAGADCSELNYGQGEGQVLIDGHEWGFYYNEQGNLDVVLHSGDLSRDRAGLVVEQICKQLNERFAVAFSCSLKEERKGSDSGPMR